MALHNDSQEDSEVCAGHRIAQLVIVPFLPVEFTEVDELPDTARGAGRCGSTGVSTPTTEKWEQLNLFDHSSGTSRAMPVLILDVTPGAIVSPFSAYKSYPAAYSEPLVGITARSFNFLILILIFNGCLLCIRKIYLGYSRYTRKTFPSS